MTAMGDHVPDWRSDVESSMQISSLDVARAYFNAKIDKNGPPTYVDSRPKIPTQGQSARSCCGTHTVPVPQRMDGSRNIRPC